MAAGAEAMSGKEGAARDGYELLPALFGLRAAAALAVVLFHLAPNVKLPDGLGFIANYFGLGVQLFFVLSGFSLMHSTSGSLLRPGWQNEYFLKRFFRIAPSFYVMLVTFAIYNRLVWGAWPSLREIAANLTFVFNLLPGSHESIVWAGWTVGVEMLFYALFPSVVLLTRSLRAAAVLFVLAAIVASAGRTLLLNAGAKAGYEHTAFVVNVVYFAAGIAAYHAYQAIRRRDPLWRHRFGLGCAAALGVLSVWAFGLDGMAKILRWNVFGAFMAVLFALLCLWQVLRPSWVFTNGPMTRLGERSYSVYLVHALVVFRLTPLYGVVYATLGTASPLAAFAVCVTVAVCAVRLIAELLYALVEAPGIRLGARIVRASRMRRDSSATAMAASARAT
jgi:peptidoglycan/LPS O-acetylase OafA/YrhL